MPIFGRYLDCIKNKGWGTTEVNVSVEEMPEDRLGSTFICIVEKDMDAAAIKEDIIAQVGADTKDILQCELLLCFDERQQHKQKLTTKLWQKSRIQKLLKQKPTVFYPTYHLEHKGPEA
eukprot:gb/GECG01013581.1/.p1 GENE.gb/GECG01013581.1/~~gb/GECG01013581.1/.p1  ORF type:complete len:119 (+),score=18.50 gb/GECG01013581.1/:1-357(+)